MEKKSINRNQILETLQWQPISQEEKERRHILGRLYGPIATFGEPTRNGRLYNKELWTKALNDELFLEKVANKTLLLELEHPDRDALDAKQACACIPEVPKIVGNDLYAVIDVLDLPNGRILKTLIDYGYHPGISSRGSGEVDANNEVDPESFFLETWDIVSTPALKKARLDICESFDAKQAKLRVALNEAYNSANEDDRKIMKNTLEKMNIQVEEAVDEVLPGGTPADIDQLPIEEIEDNQLVEAADEEVADEETAEEEVAEETDEETDEEVAEETDDTEDTDAEDVLTVKDIINDFETLGDDTIVDFAPIEIEGVKYNTLVVIQDQNDEKVTLGVECTPIEEDTKDKEAENSDDEEETEEVANETEEAVDDGDDEVVESFKDLVRQKDLLESEVKSLKNEKTVSDAKVDELQESLNKYKAAFVRTSELAAQAKTLKCENAKLNESLSAKNTKIAELEKKVTAKARLDESVSENVIKVNSLTKKLQVAETKLQESTAQLNSQISQLNETVKKRTEVAKKYKESYLKVVEHYITSKAQLLGVRPAEITGRLNESYTVDDIDTVCEQILRDSVKVNKLPFGGRNQKVRINESTNIKKTTSYSSADDGTIPLDDSLLDFLK